MDSINRQMGNDTIMQGVQQFPKDAPSREKHSFKNLIRHDYRSKCYSTDINELIEVK